MSDRDDELDPRVRVEEDEIFDPEKPDRKPTYGLGSKLDDLAEHAARRYTEDSGRGIPDEGRGLSPHVHRTPETGRGATVTLDADVEQTIGVGDELWVHVPVAGRRGWTYEVEGDESVVDVDERAEILHGTTHEPPPDGTSFVVRAERRGRVTVRFEPVGAEARVPPRRLRLTVR